MENCGGHQKINGIPTMNSFLKTLLLFLRNKGIEIGNILIILLPCVIVVGIVLGIIKLCLVFGWSIPAQILTALPLIFVAAVFIGAVVWGVIKWIRKNWRDAKLGKKERWIWRG